MRDNRLEETIELIKKDIKRIQNIQNEEISYNVKKSLQQIEYSLEDKIHDRKTIDNMMEKLDELKHDIKTEYDKKNEGKYESVSRILKNYLREETSVQKDEMFQNSMRGRTQATLDEPQNNISLEHIENIIADKLRETRNLLMRAGFSYEIVDDVYMENKHLMGRLIEKIDENVYSTNQSIDETVEMGLTDLFRNALKQDEHSNELKPKEKMSLDDLLENNFKQEKTEYEKELDAGDLFKNENKKSWELTDEEKIDFREGEEKVLDDLAKKPQEESRELDSRGLFDE